MTRRKPKITEIGLTIFLLALIFALTLVYTLKPTKLNFLYDKQGLHSKIRIFDGTYHGRPARFLQLDQESSSAMFLDSSSPQDLTYDYTKYYLAHKLFGLQDSRHALVMGGGIYSIPKALLSALPTAKVDVCELDPTLFELAKQYFGLRDDGDRLRNFAGDCRRFVETSEAKYDFVFGDVFIRSRVPSQFASQEFFELIKSKLTDRGVFVMNVIGSLSKKDRAFVGSELKTFRTAFPSSYFFAVKSVDTQGTQNLIFIGAKNDRLKNFDVAQLIEANAELAFMKGKLVNVEALELNSIGIR